MFAVCVREGRMEGGGGREGEGALNSCSRLEDPERTLI